MTENQFQLGRIGGIPVVIDYTFVLLAVLWGYGYFTDGTLNGFLTGFWIVGGAGFSILLHEFAHAVAGRWYGIESSHIELNGMGGLCYLNRSVPSSTGDIVISLAGPAVNLALWAIFNGVAFAIGMYIDDAQGLERFMYIAAILANINFMLCWFNLLPSHPLDGGKAIARMLGWKFGYDLGQRFVAYSGMLVCGYCALLGLSGCPFGFVIAYSLYLHNQQVLDTHSGPRWRREN